MSLTALILAARCANFENVFVQGKVYFTDADCYSRMTRVRLCASQPGLALRHHDFENYPAGITPHTTVVFDYLVLGLSLLFRPFSAQAFDLAGAVVSPVLGLVTGWFLLWWARRMQIPFRGCMLTLFALSPILVHGTELGRPDHQSLEMLLIAVACAAEYVLAKGASRGWAVLSGASWGLALWVSLYEPLLMLAALLICFAIWDRQSLFAAHRRWGWFTLLGIILLAIGIEWRPLQFSDLGDATIFRNWAATIGELRSVSWRDPIWFQWAGGLLVATPVLLWLASKHRPRNLPAAWSVWLALTWLLTLWQARWGYFFATMFILTLPAQLSAIPKSWMARALFVLCLWPVLAAWDARLFPDDTERARLAEHRSEAVAWREAALRIAAPTVQPFLAPWWLSPSAAYWSGQPSVAGSSHESLPGIADSARFFLATDWATARGILERRHVVWVMAYNGERTASNSASILGKEPASTPLGEILDRTPARVPAELGPVFRNAFCTLYRLRK